MSNILKKISTKTAVSVMDFKQFTVDTAVLRIMGICRKAIPGEHPQYGRFLKFVGEFQAIDLRTGNISVSSVAFLPAPVDGMLEAALQGAEDSPVEFGFDITVHPRPDLQVGYEYVVSEVIESAPSDPMAALAARMSQKALPKPVEAPPVAGKPEVQDKPHIKGKAKPM